MYSVDYVLVYPLSVVTLVVCVGIVFCPCVLI